jgi:hypothetical protein
MEKEVFHGAYKQKGFLLIAAVILVFIFSAAGSMLAYSYMKKGVAVSEDQQAQQALYLATSGLEIAKRAITNETKTCMGINGDAGFTNVSLLNGKFTVTGTESSATNALSSGITASSTSLTLSNASGFSSEGVVFIGNETIGYYSKSGNTLQNLKRGLGGTTAISHNSTDAVTQSDCLLTSTGAVPDFTSPKGRRTAQEVLSTESSGGGSLGGETPVIMTASIFDLRGSATIYNRGVTLSDPNYSGSTIKSGSDVDLRGSAVTYVSDGGSGLVQSSTSSNVQPDIQEYDSNVTSSNLYSYFFTEPLTTIYGIADHSYSKSNLSGVTGKTVWINGQLKLTGNKTYNIGTHSQPVVLVIDGDFDLAGGITINLYGLVYVTGDMKLSGSAFFVGEGAVAAEGEAKITGAMNLDLNPSALGDMSFVNPYMTGGTTTFSPYLLRRVVI